jgi:hypothetical protein
MFCVASSFVFSKYGAKDAGTGRRLHKGLSNPRYAAKPVKNKMKQTAIAKEVIILLTRVFIAD